MPVVSGLRPFADRSGMPFMRLAARAAVVADAGRAIFCADMIPNTENQRVIAST
jgi:hypothetical protein